MADDPQGVAPEYQAIWESVRNGGPGLSDATVTAIARSAHMKTALLYGTRLRASEAATAAAVERAERLTEVIEDAAVTLAMLKRNVTTEIAKHDGLYRWEGVPEAIQSRLEMMAEAALPSTPPVAEALSSRGKGA